VSTDPAADRLIEMLVVSRLVTSDDGVYEIAHEALARAWPRLRGWLDDDVEGRRMLHHLTGAADAWDQLGRPDSEVYRGGRLQRTLEWLDRTRPELTPVERDFVEAGRQLAEHEAQASAERARQQSLLIRRLRLVLTCACLLLVIALVAGGVAVHQRNVADDSSNAALASETAAVARRAGANALVTADIDRSMLLAVAALRLDDSPETRSSLLAAIGNHPELVGSTPLLGDESIDELDVTNDGQHVLTLDQRHHAWLYDAGSGQLLADTQVGPVRAEAAETDRRLAVSPDGRTVAVATTPLTGPPVRLLDSQSLTPLQPLRGLPERGWMAADLAYSGDSTHLTALLRRIQPERANGLPVEGWGGIQMQTTASVALVWDLSSNQRPVRVPLTDPNTQSVALDDTARALYTSDPLTRHDLDNRRTDVLSVDAALLELSPDGQTLAGLDDSGVVLLDARTGRLTRRLDDSHSFDHLRFSDDGAMLAGITFVDRAVRVWSFDSGRLADTSDLDLDRGESEALDFGADNLIYAAGAGQALRRWDVDGKHRFFHRVSVNPQGGLPGGGYLLPSPEGHRAALLIGPGVTFYDLDRGTVLASIPFQSGFRFSAGTWSADEQYYATAVGDWIRVWNVASGRLVKKEPAPGPHVTELDYSLDGSRLVVCDLSGAVTMLDAATLKQVGTSADVGEPAFYVTAGPDNRTAFVLTGGPSGNTFWSDPASRWALVDLRTGSVVRKGDLGMGVGWAAEYSPDGTHAAVIGSQDAMFASVGGSQTQLLVIDLETGRPIRPPLAEPSAASFHIAYSPDGAQILTSSGDGSVSLWDASSGRLSARLPIEPYTVGATFLPDGHTARIVGWYSGATYDWNTEIDSALDFACTVVGREFTAQEWTDSFGDRPYQRVCDS
jgi:WD40 repeat protein